jgi:hypothetical protein
VGSTRAAPVPRSGHTAPNDNVQNLSHFQD